jgi:N6-adenosine-specific RNA methylase IME4
MTDSPNTVHGRLLEAVHISGYSFERACSELEFLLDQDRWKSVGDGYTNVNDFLATIDFSEFRLAIEQRKKIAARLKAIEASDRSTAKLLGVSHTTIQRDAGTNVPKVTSKSTASTSSSGTYVPPPLAAVIKATTNIVRQEGKEERRQERIDTLVAKALPDGLFCIFNADPPWRTETWSDKGMDRSADNHYPTMPIEEIMALDVEAIAAKDSLLTLWVTVPHLEQAINKLLPAWGFEYKSMMTWDKEVAAMGKWMFNQTEHLIFATRGSFPVPPDDLKLPSLWREKRGEHSAKPVGILDWIDKAYPGVPKTELFRRGPPRPGWVAHGNQVQE